MVMYEKHKESGAGQETWQARLERERLQLSVSVSATMQEGMDRQKHQWRGESDEEEHFSQTTGGTALIPPRLSLQSRVLSAVHPGGLTSYHKVVVEPPPVETVPPAPSVEQVQMLAQLAQQITSSLVKLGYAVSVQDEVQAEKTGKVVEATATTRPLTTQNTQYRQRLAGHTTRVRLEAAPLASTQAYNQEPVAESIDVQRSNSGIQVQRRLSGDAYGKRYATTSAHLPAMNHYTHPQLDHGQVPALSQRYEVHSHEQARQEIYYGKGAFECGQGEISVAQPEVTTASVVQVMLVSNPGPVVVQYISLQPGSGFTVHLSAPATRRTVFNYALMQDKQGK